MGSASPKVLLEIAGRSVLERSVDAFEAAPEVDAIVVVAHESLLGMVTALFGDGKVEEVVPGGATRSASTLAALNVIADETGIVLVHDAARPLITAVTVSTLVAALADADAATIAVPADDTILRVQGDRIVDMPARSELWHAQTPQGFRLTILREAYAAAPHSQTDFSDDCGIVRRYLPAVPIRIVPGLEENPKITRPADISLAEVILAARASSGGSEESEYR